MESTKTGQEAVVAPSLPWWSTRWAHLGLLGLLVAAALLTPAVISGYWIRILTSIFMYAALASSLNIISGYAGYTDFGNVVFFGLGAYCTGILSTKFHLPVPLGMLVGVIIPALYAMLLGLPILRLRGHYFAIATIGVMEATRELVINADKLTGGGVGLTLPIPDMLPRQFYALIYYLMFGLLILYVAISYLIQRSRFGYGLRAIKADEEAAEVSGVNTTRYKVLAWTTSAAMTGLVGGLYAYWFTFIQPSDVFNTTITIQYLIMMLTGGAGTLFGPVVGAFLLQLISEVVWSHFLELHLGVLGALIVVVVLFMPRGFVPTFFRRFSLRGWMNELRGNKI